MMHHQNDSLVSSKEGMDTADDFVGLTEEVIPPPAQPDDPRQGHLEQVELATRSEQGLSATNNEYLTELRIPPVAGSGDESENSPPYNVASPSALKDQKYVPENARPVRFPRKGSLPDWPPRLFRDPWNIQPARRRGYEQLFSSSCCVAGFVGKCGRLAYLRFLAEDRRLFKEEWGKDTESWSFKCPQDSQHCDNIAVELGKKHLKVKKTIPLYIGLSTGFCGSFTSFSTFLRDAFLGLGGQSGMAPGSGAEISGNTGYRIEAVVGIIILHVACSLSALKFGSHLALATQDFIPVLPFRFIHKYLDPAVGFLGFGCWVGAVLLAIWPPRNAWRGQVIFSLVLAPMGCLFRFYLSRHLNQRKVSFLLGIFSANISGTAALGICFIIQRSGHRSILCCQVFEGFMDGFSGCATTVSTWVGELETLERRHAYV